jgi:hypothetical protein
LIPPETLNDEYHKNGALEITDARWLSRVAGKAKDVPGSGRLLLIRRFGEKRKG